MNTGYIRITFILILLYLIMSFFEKSHTFAGSGGNDTTNSVSIDITNVKIENKAFKVGEKLTFSIDYGPIQAGIATISVVDKINFKERECYRIVSEAFSSKPFSIIFKVEDKVESIIDAQGIFSWKIDKHIHEGQYHSDKYYILDYFNNIAYSVDDTVKLSLIVQDALSSLFYLRTQKLEVGKSVIMQHFDNGKFYELEVKILKKENEVLKNDLAHLQESLNLKQRETAASLRLNEKINHLQEQIKERDNLIVELKAHQQNQTITSKEPISSLVKDLQNKINKLKITIEEKNKIIEQLKSS